MKSMIFDRIMMILAALSAASAVVSNFDLGYRVYGWPMAALCWVGVAFLKDTQIRSLTKNK